MSAWMAQFLQRVRMPFNVNTLAQAAALAALDDTEFLTATLDTVHKGLDFLFAELSRRGLNCLPTQANFFLLDVKRPADDVFNALLQLGVIVRSMRAYGYPAYLRISVGLPEENQRFLEALDEVLKRMKAAGERSSGIRG